MKEKKLNLIFSIASVSLLLLFFFALYSAFKKLDYEWDFRAVISYFWQDGKPGLILQALWGTFYVSTTSIFFGSVFGIAFGLLLVSREPVARKATYWYVEVFRNTPVLVQMYISYYVIGTLFNLSSLQAGILTLSAFCAAYVAEIVRGTLQQFEKGQIEAAKSIGLTPFQTYYLVIGPQALRRMLPALVGQFVSLVKDSSLVSVLGTVDLTKAALNIVAVSFRSFETWFVIALLYLILNYSISSLGRWLERKLAVA